MQILNADEFLTLKKSLPVVDVRSPGEFAEGHIPGATNIPIFDDKERAIIGTIYKSKGRFPAIEKGLEIVGPKMAQFVREAVVIASSGRLLVHCWRGGMRSESMAWLFERVGIECFTLQGGYKSYRNYLFEKVGDLPHLIVIEGHTGSGKTEILLRLKTLGEQVIDLEGLANHKGSVFGGIGQETQPTTQQFQNVLFEDVFGFDLSKRVWIEGESQTVGRVFLPDPLWYKMNEAQCIEILVPRSERVSRLVIEYGTLPEELMENAIINLSKRLGDQRMNEILSYYREKNLDRVAGKLLEYYDLTYQFSRDKYKRKLTEIVLPNGNALANAELILEKAANLF
ncbi:MAG: tRNA 2-selenouridine(34) synthase MnmH [Bacteroidia bacterium]|nr:tRNA 2-selenouridine(34) synthase MnmH [Bacteroidia bacterium]